MKLILASASPRRAEILRSAGIVFNVLSSAVDETPMPGEAPQELVQRLALAKAELVAARAVGPAIVIAADTVVVLEGEILGKPRTSEDARQMLEKLSGRTHKVLTGVALIRLPDEAGRGFSELTQVNFALISNDEILKYLAAGEPFDKAGSYAIQGLAGRYIPRIDGCYFNVVGLPLARLCKELAELGWTEELE
jgi:septum formation protein